MRILLETDRLTLGQFTEADAEHLFELDSDPEVMRYVGRVRSRTWKDTASAIVSRFLPFYDRYEHFGFWVVVERASGEFLGWFHLTPAAEYCYHAEAGYAESDVDLGYRFRRAAWGKGYATEGARALVHRAFSRTDTAAVVATVLAGNVASIRVLEKAGLRRVLEFALPGYEMLALKYGLRREEFRIRT